MILEIVNLFLPPGIFFKKPTTPKRVCGEDKKMLKIDICTTHLIRSMLKLEIFCKKKQFNINNKLGLNNGKGIKEV